MVHASQCGVVDHTLGSRDQRRKPSEARHRSGRLPARLRHPLEVDDDPSPFIGGADRHEDEFRSPGRLSGSLEVQPSVRLGPDRGITSPVVLSTRISPGLALNSGVTTLPSACSIREGSGWVHDPGPSGSSSPSSRACEVAIRRWSACNSSRTA
jgi:hypothetical protein